eukprot:4446418-Amphidinium_carterae.1
MPGSSQALSLINVLENWQSAAILGHNLGSHVHTAMSLRVEIRLHHVKTSALVGQVVSELRCSIISDALHKLPLT